MAFEGLKKTCSGPFRKLNLNQTDKQSPYPVQWATPSPSIQGCPEGLEIMIPLDYLLVQQIMETISDYVSTNKYYVKTGRGQILFFAEEDSSCCARNCFHICRPFRMNITDINQRVVIHLHQPSAIFCKKIFVEAPPGQSVGSVQKICSFSKPTFHVVDPTGQLVSLIKGPTGYVWCGCCKRNVSFKILSPDGLTEVGSICKVWSGFGQEAYTNVDKFTLSFSATLDVRLKAVLLGACILIDMIYFETQL